MCGIWAVFGSKLPSQEDIKKCVEKIHNRGPEYMKIQNFGSAVLGFTRLAINGLTERGHQPIVNDDIAVVCNGELYNYKELAMRWSIALPEGSSDCEILPTLLRKLDPTEVCRTIDGVFAFVAIDQKLETITIARDPYGVRPLYIGRGDGFQVFSSEIKALTPICERIEVFPPGAWYRYTLPKDGQNEVGMTAFGYHQIPWLKNPALSDASTASFMLRSAFETAVNKRLMSDRPIGALLSGGLDSSLVCAVAAKFLKKQDKKLTTFSIGMPGSTDLVYAKKVASYIDSDHHEIILTESDFFNAIPEVIKAAETYDITSVRASVGNWLVSKYIKEHSECKVIFNGDGADEIFGSYLYFNYAPNDREFEEEVDRLLTDIHYFDVLRSDRSISSQGLEPRTPFLDKQFVSVARSIATEWRRPIQGKQVEKWILRRAFNDTSILPPEVLWRRKEAFSDGVSSTEKSWYQEIQERVSKYVPDDWESIAKRNYIYLTPTTMEQYYYRFLYEAYYGKLVSHSVVPYFWMPKWIQGVTDPSARTLPNYAQH
jgi:asparagine synthase (glutamine-hydrolysing)